MVDYAKIQQTVENKLSIYGLSLTLRITARSAYNATLDSFTESHTDYTVSGLRRDYKNREFGDLIKVGDVEFMISDDSLPALIETENITLIDGVSTWYPVRINPFCPGGTTIFYKIQAAREKR